MRKLVIAALVIGLILSVGSTKASADRLKEILDRGTVRAGIMLIVPPFGQYDKDQKPVGFDVDLANKIAEAMKVKLEIVPVLAANRIPYLVTDKVDMVVGTFSRTSERSLTIDYSVPYIRTGPAVLVRAEEQEIKSVKDLAGKKVALLKGTVGALWCKKLAPEGTKYVEFDLEPDQLLALMQGKADALVQDETIMSAWVEKYPGKLKIVGELFYGDFIAIGLKKGEYNLKNWLDWFIFELHNLGIIEEIWSKWFSIPMRPVHANPFF